jgi:hypothetical protein
VATPRAPGSDGVIAPGGFLFETGERNSKLIGSNRWVTYDNLLANVTIVAAAIGVWLDLSGSSKWTAVPNPKGGADAKFAAELVQDGFLDARMATRWRSVVKRQAVKRFRGFAKHAKGWRRRADGAVVLNELAHRPQWSIERWIKPSETEPWTAVVQRTRMGKEYTIDRADLFYSHEGSLGDDPKGVGLFRHLVAVADIFDRFRQLQAIAFDTDCNGIPLGRAPLSKLAKEAVDVGGCANDDADAISAYVRAAVAPVADMIENRVVTSNRSLLLDSLPYFSQETDGSAKPSGQFEWSVDTLRQQIGSIPELGKALDELNWEMAVVLSAEHLLMGGKGTSGAFAASADKSSLFSTRIDGTLDDIGDDAERDIVPDLLARNGITDERCMPSLQHQSVARSSARAAAEMLKLLAAAKLRPGDPAENVLRAREELPPAPEVSAEEIAADAKRRAAGPPEVGKPADNDTDEEEDDKP